MAKIDNVKADLGFHEKLFFGSLAVQFAMIGWLSANYQGAATWLVFLTVFGVVATAVFNIGFYHQIKHLIKHLIKSLGKSRVSLPRERFWDIQVSKIDSPTRQPLCPGCPASVPLRHTFASSALATQHSLKWLDGVSDVILDPLWRLRTTGLQNYLRLPGTTSPRVRSMAGSV